ncbi:MAG: hypothetical protein Q8S20_04220 [Sulfuritalea sp.]|nr:hypothetical protein [Sulfuritalea sp.]
MVEDQRHVLPELLLGKPEFLECGTLSSWLPVWRATSSSYGRYGPYVAAIAAAFRADRLAWAFFSGYQGALQAAFPELLAGAEPRIASLGANESGRKLTEIDTALFVRNGVLRLKGRKSWVLSGIDDLELYVLARTADGPARGPGSLVVARVRRSAAGVEMSAPRPQAVVPELAHCAVSFNDVPIDDGHPIPGDGYADHAKPFRLREDVFVTGSPLAFLLAQGHAAGWPTRWRQRCMAIVVALGECAARSPSDSATELLTAGALSLGGEVIEQAETLMAQHESIAFARWRRDKPILGLGKDARRLRVQLAWARSGWTESTA